MKKENILINIKNSMKNSLERFPITIGISAACSIMLILANMIEDDIAPWALAFILSIPLSMSIKLYFEKKENVKSGMKVIAYTLCIAFSIMFKLVYFKENDDVDVNVIRYVGTFIVFYIGGFVIACYEKKGEIELYAMKILNRIFTTILYAVVLFLGISGSLLTCDKLLGITMDSDIYLYLWIIVVGIFSVTFFLGGVPKKDDVMEKGNFSKLIKILFVNIVAPLLSVYTIILYVYFAKVLFMMEWPEIMVSHLVLWYSIIGLIVMFFITPIKDSNRWSKIFYKFYPIAILPLLGMMFFSMGVRLKAYGITENRYFVVIFGIWVLYSMINLILKKGSGNRNITIFLLAVILLSVYGPVKASSVSKWSQSRRFYSILNRNDMIKDGEVVKAPEEISKQDKDDLRSILHYYNYEHSLEHLKYLPDGFKLNQCENVLGFNEYEYHDTRSDGWFRFNVKNERKTIDISGYDVMLQYNYDEDFRIKNSLRYRYKDGVITIFKENRENAIYKMDFKPFIQELNNQVSESDTTDIIENNKMELVDENNSLKVQILFNNLSGTIKSDGKVDIRNINFVLLVKEK